MPLGGGEGMSEISLRMGKWQDALAGVTCDALITDAPYSARTHKAYSGGLASGRDGWVRRDLDYASLDESGVREIVESWAPRTRGWMVSITDHILAPMWSQAMEDAGRYVFAPLPAYIPGRSVRLNGDGPSCWAYWIVVSRPRTREFMRWGTLPGGYQASPGNSGHRKHMRIGGKPLALMRHLVADYSRPGDVVCDPFAGGATTLIAAKLDGRIGIGAEVDPDTHAEATRRIRGARGPVEQANLFA